MKQSKVLIVLIVIASIVLLYMIYNYFFGSNTSSNGGVTPTSSPMVTPTILITPTPEPTIVPTPIITPEPTMPPKTDTKETIYNDVYLTYKDDKKTINPMVDDDNSVIFEIEGNNDSNNSLYYEIVLDSKYKASGIISKLTFNLMEIDDNDNIINRINVDKYNTIQNRVIYTGDIVSIINKRYKLTVTSEGKGDYNEIAVSVRVVLNKTKQNNKASNLVLKSIQSHPNTTWKDTKDNVIYLSGSNSVVNYNYVLYSGKLWRITAINPDGSLRLMSDNVMTTLFWGKSSEYKGSWVYQWLNEDFYDTLYNPNNILVQNVLWNYTYDSSDEPKKPDTLPNQRTVTAPVGLLSSYEYLNAYRNSKYTDNYLNISHCWWHLTPRRNQAIRTTGHDGKPDSSNRDPSTIGGGVRPVIYLNNLVEFTGTGSKNDPYRVVGDIPNAKSNDLVNTRISGEYVSFNNAVYRIVNIEGNKTKIQMVDYLKLGGKRVDKHLSRTIHFGSPTNDKNERWWDYYLINVWYPTIPQKYQNMVTSGTYYLGGYLNTNYKNTICQNSNLDSVTVKNCSKYSDSNHIYIGNVGLIRVGEMFSAKQDEIEKTSPANWTITPFDHLENVIILETNSLWHHNTVGGFHVVHPTFYLRENVKITSGMGTFSSPYVISQ